MQFVYGYEKYRFDKDWEKMEKEYLKHGMDEKSIRELRKFDRKAFSRERAFRTRNIFFEDYYTDKNRTVNLIEKYNRSALSVFDTYFEEIENWFELIDDEELAERIRALDKTDLIIFRDYYVYAKQQKEIAEKLGSTRRRIQRRLANIRKKLGAE